MEEEEERQAAERRGGVRGLAEGGERWRAVGLQSKALIFNLNRPRYLMRVSG